MIAASVLVRISITDPSEVVEKLLRIEGKGPPQAHVTAGSTETLFIAFIEGPDLDAR